MRAVPASFDPDVVREIDRRLDAITASYGVHVAWGIESGSRAWGFPSPDSDYDCRFIYVRRREDYLSLWPPRDVIETPLDKIFDVNGWDLRKAVTLIAKGNVTATEWLRSPIVYRGDIPFRDALLSLAEEIVERDAVGRHFLHVANQQRAGAATLKRFFYVLRPSVALRWLETHPTAAIPPMDLPTLLAEAAVADDVHKAAKELIRLKAVTRELGTGAPAAVLQRFVDAQLERAQTFESATPVRDAAQVRARADEAFRRLVG